MTACLVGLGSNLGDRRAWLDLAVQALRSTPHMENVVVSSYHETSAVGGPHDQQAFLNAALRCETTLSPLDFASTLWSIETSTGRIRETAWGPRTLDLDLLLFGEEIIENSRLIVPHRFLPFRRFVLEPACEIAAAMRHPLLNRTLAELFEHLLTAPPRFGVMCTEQERGNRFATKLAETVADLLPATSLNFVARPDPELKAIFFVGEPTEGARRSLLASQLPTLFLSSDEDVAIREAVGAIRAMR